MPSDQNFRYIMVTTPKFILNEFSSKLAYMLITI